MNASIRLCSCIPLIALAADLSFAPNLGLPGGDLAAQAPEHHIVAMVVDESSLEPLEGVLFQLDGANLTGVTDDRIFSSLSSPPSSVAGAWFSPFRPTAGPASSW